MSDIYEKEQKLIKELEKNGADICELQELFNEAYNILTTKVGREMFGVMVKEIDKIKVDKK